MQCVLLPQVFINQVGELLKLFIACNVQIRVKDILVPLQELCSFCAVLLVSTALFEAVVQQLYALQVERTLSADQALLVPDNEHLRTLQHHSRVHVRRVVLEVAVPEVYEQVRHQLVRKSIPNRRF